MWFEKNEAVKFKSFDTDTDQAAQVILRHVMNLTVWFHDLIY